jgi:hypothetical protein
MTASKTPVRPSVFFAACAAESRNCQKVSPHTADEQKINNQYFMM